MIETSVHGEGVIELSLSRPPVNAMDATLIETLKAALDQAAADHAAVVLSGRPGMFTAGLDVPALLGLGRGEIESLWSSFLALMHTLATSPAPVVCAITGHSPAGGAVMAVFADYRIMAEGEFRIGLNEVAVGLPVPSVVAAAFARLVGEARAERLLSAAALLTPQEALRAGMVDEVVAAEEVRGRAVAYARTLAAMPAGALRATRRECRRSLTAQFDAMPPDFPQRMADVWFGRETQQAMRTLVARLREGR